MLRIDFVAVLALGLVRQNSLRDCVATLRQLPQVRSRGFACPTAGKTKPRHCAPHRPGNRPQPGPPAATRGKRGDGIHGDRAPRPCPGQRPVCRCVRSMRLGRRAAQRSRPVLVCRRTHKNFNI